MTDIEAKKQDASKYVRVKDIMYLCDVSESRAYRIMQKLNQELEAKGYITTAGRVSRKYFLERLYI